ncbi:hypothetical protein, partial [Corynebacterium faecium]|uniref:hypothetical protein n=1 Tax=Corynebacterium faecium TaxID=3016001 RepID=UPI0022B35EA0
SDNVGALTGRVTSTLFRTVTGCSPSRYSILTTVLLDATTQQAVLSWYSSDGVITCITASESISPKWFSFESVVFLDRSVR